MKRPLLLFSASLSIGIVYSYFLHSFLLIAISIILILFAALYIKKKYAIGLHILFGVVLFYSVGAIEYTAVSGHNEKIFEKYSGQEVAIRGYLASEPEIKDERISYIIRTREILYKGRTKQQSGKVLVTSLIDDGMEIIEYGQGIEIRGQLQIPRERRNPGGFDYRRYLAGTGISATMFARAYNMKLLEDSNSNILLKAGLMLRHRVIKVVNNSLPEEQAGLLNGMLIGYRGGLSKYEQNAFSDAGLSHIMAVSGANVAFIVFPLVFLFKKSGVRQAVANIVIIFILLVFICVTGFSPSVARAVIMAVIILLGQIIRREPDIYSSIALAAAVLMLYNPYVLFDIGFQLSFGATISLILFHKRIKEKLSFKFIPGFLTDLCAVTIAAQVGVIPITAYHFNKISIISLFSNLLAVPLTGIITILGFVMALLGQFSEMLSLAAGLVNNTLLTVILYITKISSELPFAVLKIITPNIAVILLYYIIAVFFLWYKPKYKPEFKIKPAYCFFACLLLAGMLFLYELLPGSLHVVFVDVGQGDCTFVKTGTGRTALIDGGGASAATAGESNVGETTVIPFLLDYGVSRIDTVVATHGHDDHIQGLFPVLKEMKVGKLVIPGLEDGSELEKLVETAEARGIPVYKCVSGDVIKLDKNTSFDVLHPGDKFKIDKSYSNNSSLVVKLHYRQVNMLFVGDIENEAEELLVSGNINLKSDVLKVAHHGSPSSSSESFIRSVKPSVAVISVGKNNFGHPGSDVLQRLKNNAVRFYRTDESGAVLLKTDGKKIKISKTIGDK